MEHIFDTCPAHAIPIPWHIDRSDEAHPRVTNVSEHALHAVRVFADDGRSLHETEQWGTLLPGESAQLCLCNLDPDDTTITLAWHRIDDLELLWRFVI